MPGVAKPIVWFIRCKSNFRLGSLEHGYRINFRTYNNYEHKYYLLVYD